MSNYYLDSTRPLLSLSRYLHRSNVVNISSFATRFAHRRSVPGFVLLLCSVVVTWQIDVHRKTFCDITTEAEIFMTPFVPYTPAFAVVLNFFLMAQFNLQDHIIFLSAIGICVGAYVAYKSAKHASKRARSSFRYSKYGRDVRKEFGTCQYDEGAEAKGTS